MDNRGFALKSFLVMVALSMVVVLTVYLIRNEGSQTTSVAAFYDRYLQEREIDEEMLTEELIDEVRENGPAFLFCAESIPDDFEIKMVEEREDVFAVHVNHLNGPILVRVDENGKIVRIECPFEEQPEIETTVEEDDPVESEIDSPTVVDIPPVLRAKRDLAVRLGIEASKIEVRSTETVIFSDSTLGMSSPGEVYDQSLTPGYLILLSVNGIDYRYHADETRTIFVP